MVARDFFLHALDEIIDFLPPGHVLRPRREEIDYLIQRVQEDITRNQKILTPAALDEYQQALKVYQAIARDVR